MSDFFRPVFGVRAGRRSCAVLGAAVASVLAVGSPASALDTGTPGAPEKLQGSVAFESARQALDDGLNELDAGNTSGSLKALNYAASQGDALALWKLGTMYEGGTDGVQRDDVRAYRYFDALVRDFDEDKADPQSLGAVSEAVVALAQYELTGIAGTDVRADPEHAMDMLQYAATSFKSTEAQFRLGRIYLDGTAVTSKDVVRAARWLALAANKDHHGAEATLGHMMFVGLGMSTQHARGLAWEMRGMNGARGQKDDWIREIYLHDSAAASPEDREMAKSYYSFFKANDRIPVPAQPPSPGGSGKNLQNVMSVAPAASAAQPVAGLVAPGASPSVPNAPVPVTLSADAPGGSGNSSGSASTASSVSPSGSSSVSAAAPGTGGGQSGPTHAESGDGGANGPGEHRWDGSMDHHWDGSMDHHWDAFRVLQKQP